MSSKITDHQTENSRDVQAVRLKDFLTRTVDFLKVDIEGAEFEVMMDVADQLHHVRNLFIEYHGVFGQEKGINDLLTANADGKRVSLLHQGGGIHLRPSVFPDKESYYTV